MATTANCADRARAKTVQSAQSAVERLALRPEEAAASLGVSRSFFFAEVLPELRTVRRGRVRLIPVVEIEEWLYRASARLFD